MYQIEHAESNILHVKSTWFRLEKLLSFMKLYVMLESIVNPIFVKSSW